MDRSWLFRLVMVLGVCGAALYFLYPSYFYYAEATEEQRAEHGAFCDALADPFQCLKFNLGLDLQGGVHLVMGVRVEKAVEQRVDRLGESLRAALDEASIGYASVTRPRDTAELVLQPKAGVDEGEVEKLLRSDFSILEVTGRRDGAWVLALVPEELKFTRDMAVEQSIKTIRNRADKLGVTEPAIARRGDTNVLIQLPGVKDPDRAIAIIGRTAQLAFHIVDEAGTSVFDGVDVSTLPEGVRKREGQVDGPDGNPIREVFFEAPEHQREAAMAALASYVPGDRILLWGAQGGDGASTNDDGVAVVRTYLMESSAGITGDYLTAARVEQNPRMPSDHYVIMTFDTKGAKVFADLTERNVQRRMAIVLDGRVNSAPVIQEKIGGGTARITLGSAGDARSRFEEAKDLSLVLKAGALPAPVEIREKRQVGQTLGKESVEAGTQAILWGALLVVLFMIAYYRGAGLIANIALALNVLFVFAVLALFEATLTLPGMAGIVLTIGMAVDANVIIFERIREELRVGKTPRAAIEAGYSKAFSTIVDANVTTLIAGIVLMQYGSGPVRGFAVTLIVGILCSMFTALVVTRLCFDFFTQRRRLQTLSI